MSTGGWELPPPPQPRMAADAMTVGSQREWALEIRKMFPSGVEAPQERDRVEKQLDVNVNIRWSRSGNSRKETFNTAAIACLLASPDASRQHPQRHHPPSRGDRRRFPDDGVARGQAAPATGARDTSACPRRDE